LAILAWVTWLWAQPLDGSISFKFLLETRLKSESIEPFIGFLIFLVNQELGKNLKYYVFLAITLKCHLF